MDMPKRLFPLVQHLDDFVGADPGDVVVENLVDDLRPVRDQVILPVPNLDPRRGNSTMGFVDAVLDVLVAFGP
ncbi:hypothetical protein D3C80_1645080 [compost metagenome]